MTISQHPGTQGDEPSFQQRIRRTRTRSTHDVQFYEGEEFLVGAASEYLGTGLSAGDHVIVIATETHRAAFARELTAKGYEVARVLERRQLTVLDAHATLERFMVDGVPDPTRFRETIVPLLKDASSSARRSHVRAYGEMVDLLAKQGNSSASIQLEALWNELVDFHDFDLLCGYAMSNFATASDALNFREICRQHAHVAPTERYTQSDGDQRLLEITLLQQRAQALEHEIARRETLERQLREALEDQERALHAERAARAEAESANRAKNQFLAVMSHELRTPLNAIAGHTQLMELELHGPITSAQREALSRIDRSQQHLLSLVNDVLNLARVDSGREEYAIAPMEIGPLVDAIVAMISPLLAMGDLDCQVAPRLHDAPPLVALADHEKVQQILLNLIGNAIKFTPPGGRISIDARTGADTVHLTVTDTGVGIPPEKIDAVFEPFVQLATRLSSRQDGIGLGLTISRKFARAMHGDLTVSSGAEGGASFRLTLPAAIAAG